MKARVPWCLPGPFICFTVGWPQWRWVNLKQSEVLQGDAGAMLGWVSVSRFKQHGSWKQLHLKSKMLCCDCVRYMLLVPVSSRMMFRVHKSPTRIEECTKQTYENQVFLLKIILFLYVFLLWCWPNGLPFQPCLQACPASCMAPAPDVPAAPATRCGARAKKFRHRDAFAGNF